jgi:hypothetical protein
VRGMREIKFRFWNGKKMLRDYKDASIWNGLLVCEGDTIPLQFTGLKDKNGKEIYEGDLLTGHDLPKRNPFKVKYDVEMCMFTMPYSYCKDDLEIIGNIYENSELFAQENHNT